MTIEETECDTVMQKSSERKVSEDFHQNCDQLGIKCLQLRFLGNSPCQKYGICDVNDENLDSYLCEDKPVDSFHIVQGTIPDHIHQIKMESRVQIHSSFVGTVQDHLLSINIETRYPIIAWSWEQSPATSFQSRYLNDRPTEYSQFGQRNSPRSSSQNLDEERQTGSMQYGRANSSRTTVSSHIPLSSTPWDTKHSPLDRY
ncbi:unnamed protein product [Mytilus edulis]|uniref:Uncharacterized protein n=1 Tax=Mytilus edulis TaxID=6550 RepID=A0A8S3QX75_MYTED|nr:unnamed protein product [Mytilus edulis]